MLDSIYLDKIKRFEGFAPEARWDYAQHSNGYGTRARFPGEVIDKAEADRRFAIDVEKAAGAVDAFAPGLNEGVRAALTSLTFNAGPSWTRGGLGQAIKSGDFETARAIFVKYDQAGGKVLPGLSARRQEEAAWFGTPDLAETRFTSARLRSHETTPGLGSVIATDPKEKSMPVRSATLSSPAAIMDGRLAILDLLSLLAGSTADRETGVSREEPRAPGPSIVLTT